MYRVKITGYDRFTGGMYNEYRYFRFKIMAAIYTTITRWIGRSAELEVDHE